MNRTIDTNDLEKTELSLGFIPLTDCAPLIVAKEKGYFEKYGLDISLSKETSWANIRDKVAIGILDGAQMLAPMPLAMTLGIGPIHKPMVTAFSMDLNGNAITVSNQLHKRMTNAAPEAMRQRSTSVQALKAVIDANRHAGKPPLTFAVVFPFSPHNYELRYWMASAGIDPDRDVRLVVVPPPQMVSQLEQGLIDGYSVGEPWNALAVQRGLGHTLITKYEIWNNSPEKVFGVTEEWAAQNPNTHQALLMALLEASSWVDQPENRVEVTAMISRSIYVNAPEHTVRMSMTGTYQYAPNALPEAQPDFNVFQRYCANYPWRSHAVWFLTQMIRWGQIDSPIDIYATAESVYRPELYRQAAGKLGIGTPSRDYKPEGTHHEPWTWIEATESLSMGANRFFDGLQFDPLQPFDYVEQFTLNNMALPMAHFRDAISTPSPKAVQLKTALELNQ